ncbi:oligosaccharide flippase family protein [Clostridium sp.]|uniref:putative polysaccharide biosynthesis protein n=1 Tax=Clostridium sp. TaxID=1506 RepID=UPI003463FFA5
MKEQSTTKGFAILSLAGILVKVMSLLYVPLLVNIIGDEGYGIYSGAYVIFTLTYVITNSGMQTAISKQVSELIELNNYRDAVKTFKIARSILLGVGMISCIILLQFAMPIAKFTKGPQGFLALITLAPAIVVTSVLAAYRGYFQGRSIMTPTAVSQILEQIFNVVFSLAFAALLIKNGPADGAAGGTLGTVLGALIAALYLIKKYNDNKIIKISKSVDSLQPKRLSNREIIRKLFKYGFPITLSAALQYFGNVVDMIVVRGRLGVVGFSEAETNVLFGLISKYNTLINVPLTLIAALCAAIIPAISRAVISKDKKTIREKIGFSFKVSYMISIPCAFGFSILSEEIYKLIFMNNIAGYELLTLGAIAVVFTSIVQIQTIILQCMNKLYAVLISLSMGILAKVAANYFLVAIPEINVKGAVLGTILCSLIPMIINQRILNSTLKIRVSLFRYAIKPFTASILMTIFVFITRIITSSIAMRIGSGYIITVAFPTLITILVGVFAYSYGIILTGGITKKDINSLSPRLQRMIPRFMRRSLK